MNLRTVKVVPRRHRGRRFVKRFRAKIDGIVCITKTRTNLFITLISLEGKVILEYSGGNVAMLGPKKRTPNAASQIGFRLGQEARQRGYKRCYLRLDGPINAYIRQAVRALKRCNLKFVKVEQRKVIAHNGVRKRKLRRK